MITTTLKRIKKHNPCGGGWKNLLKHLGKTKADNEPLSFAVIVESNGLDDALWCCMVEPQHHKEWRLFAVWCAVQVKHLMEDKRSLDAFEVAERYANGKATKNELTAAGAAAGEVAWAAVGVVAWAAGEAACEAAGEAAWAAAWEAAGAAVRAAAGAAWEVAGAAAGEAAGEAVRDAQKNEFLRVVS